jgi:hypothetical protein
VEARKIGGCIDGNPSDSAYGSFWPLATCGYETAVGRFRANSRPDRTGCWLAPVAIDPQPTSCKFRETACRSDHRGASRPRRPRHCCPIIRQFSLLPPSSIRPAGIGCPLWHSVANGDCGPRPFSQQRGWQFLPWSLRQVGSYSHPCKPSSKTACPNSGVRAQVPGGTDCIA